MTAIVPTGLNTIAIPRVITLPNSSANATMRAKTGTGWNVKAKVRSTLTLIVQSIYWILMFFSQSLKKEIVFDGAAIKRCANCSAVSLCGLHYTLGLILEG